MPNPPSTSRRRLSDKPEVEILAGEADDGGRKRKRIDIADGKAGGKKAKGADGQAGALADDDFFGGGSDSE